MKRLMAILCLCLAVPGFGCAAQPLSADDFVFVFEGKSYRLGEAAAPLVSAVEASVGPLSVYEAESCLFTGLDKEYECEALLLATYPIGPEGSDVLETIYVMDPAYPTARGICVGDSRAALVDAYGEDYVEAYDQLTYAQGDILSQPVLVFILDLDTETVAAYFMMRNTGA